MNRGEARRAALALTLLGALAGTRAARAAPPRTSSLGWTRLPGAETCIGTRELAQIVERRMRRPIFVSAALAEVAVEARIERTAEPARWRAVLTLSDARGAELGTRELTSAGADCRAVDEELALVIALMIDPEAALFSSAPAPALPFTPPAIPPPCAPCAPAAPAPRWRAGVALGTAAGLGLLPSVGAAIQLRARVVPPRFWAFEVGGTFWLPAGTPLGALGGRFSLVAASLSTCPLTLAASGTSFSACAGVQIGALLARGFSFDFSGHQEQFVFDVALEARVARVIAGPLFVALGVGLIVPTVRDQFYYKDALGNRNELFRMSPVAGALDAGIGVEFP